MQKIVNKKARFLIIALSFLTLFFVFIVLLVLFLIHNDTNNENKIVLEKEVLEKKICKNCKERLIDGVYVEEGSENIQPVAIVIDNHFQSWPPNALSRANIVYEMPAEGGITRYLAILANNEDFKKIGPIRSARPYFLDIAKEFEAIFMHCGGSPEALVQIAKEKILNINEFYKGHFFWREKNRTAPHNIFSSKKLIDKYLENLDDKMDFSVWSYKDDEPKEKIQTIKIDFKKPYNVEWQYQKDENKYVRHLNNELHKDETGEIIKTKNLIVQYVDTEVLDSKLRLKIDLIGKGEALICLDGECKEGEWKKINKESKTKYYINNEEARFNRGNFWIEVINPLNVNLSLEPLEEA